MKGKQIGLFCCTVAMAAVLLAGCGTTDDGAKASKPGDSAQTAVADLGKSKDGTYTAESSADDKLGKTDVAITVRNHKITGVVVKGIDRDGKIKDETYGKNLGEDRYKRAQTAYRSMKMYGDDLVKTQSVDAVDAVAGATVSHTQFVEAARKALVDAQK